MKTGMRVLTRCFAAVLATAVCLPLGGIFASHAATGEVVVSSVKETAVSLAKQYSDFTYNGKSEAKIYIEEKLCPEPYFDNVRTGDTISVQIRVGAAGTYKMCLVTGWAEGVAGGNFDLLLDGEKIGTLVNKIPGAGWRTWKNTTQVSVALPAGVHIFTVRSNADGPNVEGLRFAPENIEITADLKDCPLFIGKSDNAAQITGNYAVQFNSDMPFCEISFGAPSYNNDIGSLRVGLYAWNGSYEQTLRGVPVAQHEFVDFVDNATLTLRIAPYADAGEYLVLIENTSAVGEQVGIWTGSSPVENVRNYKDDAEVSAWARMTVRYMGENMQLGALSAKGEQAVDQTEADLYPFGAFLRYKMEEYDKFGVRFATDGTFEGCEAYIPAASSAENARSLTLSLYAWKGNYAKTIREAPLVQQRVDGVSRNSWARLQTGKQQAGEYLFTLTDGSENMRVNLVEAADPNTELYVNRAKCKMSLVSRLVGARGKMTPVSPSEDQVFVDPTTWVAVDGLGRKVADASNTGEVRKDKFVGIFYHTWHASHSRNVTLNANTVVSQYPEALHDYKHAAWKGVGICFWDEPIWGYYNNGIDRFVLRSQAELLADAGVDVVIFDNTNGTENYIDAVLELCEVFAEARADGVQTPKISAMLNMFDYQADAVQLREFYDVIYSKGLYEDLWFYWDGKPLMVGSPTGLDAKDEKDRIIAEFFTYRPINPCYTEDYRQIVENGKVTVSWVPEQKVLQNHTMWKWISVYPQQKMYRVDDKEKSKPEEMCVCIAENWSDAKGLTAMSSGLPGLYGRAYSVKNGGLDPREDAILYGANFAEQFEYAISCDPSFIYITGWNEWVAGRYEEMWGTTNALPDNALPGYSRDIEPSTGVLKDHYYYQMVSYIRRFKGVNRQQSASAPTSVDLTKGTAQWENVTPVYESYPNNTFPRDADGYAGYHYTNTTGRNDIVSAKVTYDADYVYFMVQTKDALTSKEDSAWMRLLIGITGSRAAAWEGYHFIVNRTSPAQKTSLERSIGGWNWEKVCDVDYSVQDNMLQIAIPRSALGVTGEEFSLFFKWSDNMQTDGDIMDFYNNGDVAPEGRFSYLFTVDPATADTATQGTSKDTTEAKTENSTATEQRSDAETTAQDNKHGCGSVAGGGVAMAIAATGTAVFLKRRKRKE